jgi:hypothetical protein
MRAQRLDLVVEGNARAAECGTFRTGQAVWLNGRAASFCYDVGPRTAVIRYGGERGTRVVPLRKLAAASPTEGPQIPIETVKGR